MYSGTDSRPTLRQLEYLVAVADEGHIGRAAESCHVAQPSLSAQLKQLEHSVGTVVIERIGRGIQLTPAGRDLAERARRVLRDTDDLVALGRQSATQLRGRLRIAAIPTVAPYLLPRFVPLLRELHSEAETHLREMQTPALVPALARGEIDLGLMALPVEDESLDHVNVLDDPFELALAPQHVFAGVEDVPVDELVGEAVLLLEDGHCLRDQALEICSRVGAEEAGEIQATSLSTLCQMVAAGMGITLLPRSARSVEARDGTGIVVRPFRGEPPTRQLVLTWRRRSPAAALYRELGETLRDALD
ncbi:MAG: LysR substrate-binding domain-containing protein [Acidimicrobiales bacterium]|nr:LysR substrate-binding domain-containing protein [Acidimicrobiales bacterium]